MKKIYIALAVIAAATLVSCEREQSFEGYAPVGENGLAFVMSGVSTRSAVESKAAKGVTIPMGQTDKGEALYLEEIIEELNPLPATKGTPAYTVNVGKLYSTMGVYASGDFGDAVFQVEDATMYDREENYGEPSDATINPDKGWRYLHNYAGDPWPDETTPVDFYLRMPATQLGVSDVSNVSQKTSFKFTSQYTAAAQQDILFSQTSLSKERHNEYLPKGAPVMMYHALTGVKFRTGHDNQTGTKTIITKVEFSNLYDKGDCTIDVSAENKVQWSNLTMNLGTFSQSFKNEDYSAAAGVDGSYSFDKDNPEGDYEFGSSWYSAAADKNLNNENGEWTFWFIPQTITSDVTLKVYFRVKTSDTPDGNTLDGSEIVHTINFGDLVGSVEWKAGQLRTYTLKPIDVDVDIFDQLTDYKKDNLHVTNTGNVDEYVRMLVIGNWYGWESAESKAAGDEPSILVGYVSADHNDNRMITPWSRWETLYGDFDATFLGGELASDRTDWVRASGGYYYTEPIGPGEALPTTSPLFKSYTLDDNSIPTIYIPSNTHADRVPAYGVHLIMEVVVQAIGVPKKENGSNVWWKHAWYDATGIEKLKPTADEEAAHAND